MRRTKTMLMGDLLDEFFSRPYVAARVAELGAGLKLEKADAASIRTAVDAVLQTPSYRANAQNIRESFLRCGGAKAAVDKILSVADRR